MVTAKQLLDMLQAEVADGGGDEIMYVEVNGYTSPLADVEPGDGLKGLYLIGQELPKS